MAYNFAVRARRVAWNSYDEKRDEEIPTIRIRRVGTDDTLNDEDCAGHSSTSIQRIDISEDVSEFVNALQMDGCVIIENFTTSSSLQEAERDTRSWIQTEYDEESGPSPPLIKQSATLRNGFFANDLYQKLCEEFLTREVIRLKKGRPCLQPIQPIFSSTSGRVLRTTDTVKGVPRADASLAIKHNECNQYHTGRDAMLGLIVPGSKNNRVQVLPRSHLLGTSSPDFEDVVEEELDIGQALIVLGSLYHQVTASTEVQDQTNPPLAYVLWSCAGVYRPEEQSASMISVAEARTYPQVVQERLR